MRFWCWKLVIASEEMKHLDCNNDALYHFTSVNCLKPKSALKFTIPQQYLTSLHLWVKPLDSLKCLWQKNMLSIVCM